MTSDSQSCEKNIAAQNIREQKVNAILKALNLNLNELNHILSAFNESAIVFPSHTDSHISDVGVEISSLGNGLINYTFLIQSHTQSHKKWVLQRINEQVFPEPETIIKNMEVINAHLIHKKGINSYSLQVVQHIKNTRGKTLLCYKNQYWRAMEFVESSYNIEEVLDQETARQAAQAFAHFSATLADLSPQSLTPVIDDFFSVEHRLDALRQSITHDPNNRLSTCQPLIAEILNQHMLWDEVKQILPKIPLRITHNDTKINNLLFSQTENNVQAVIDLDTCMPGFLMHDFGDLVRSTCSTLSEDDSNIEALTIKYNIFDAIVHGYITTLKQTLTLAELESLILGSIIVPYLLSIRFITDYINGDKYFSIEYPEQNLNRAKNQFALFKCLVKNRKHLTQKINAAFIEVT